MGPACSPPGSSGPGGWLTAPQGEQPPLLGPADSEQHAGPGRLPVAVWQALIADPDTRARYGSYVYRRADDQCWPWVGAVSGGSGHGKFRAGSRRAGSRAGGVRPASHVVTSHVYGWQLIHGPLLAGPDEDPVLRHRCDEAGCHNPDHWILGSRQQNTIEYFARRYRAGGALADVRGPAGRARAVRDAILAARAAGGDVEAAIRAAVSAGIADAGQGTLF